MFFHCQFTSYNHFLSQDVPSDPVSLSKPRKTTLYEPEPSFRLKRTKRPRGDLSITCNQARTGKMFVRKTQGTVTTVSSFVHAQNFEFVHRTNDGSRKNMEKCAVGISNKILRACQTYYSISGSSSSGNRGSSSNGSISSRG